MEIIAHRGASAECPGNTLAAFERALAIGVDAIEADLLVTRDGVLVTRHDDLIEQDGQWHYIHELSFEQLQRIDLGSGARIPSLEQFFERFHGRCRLVLDLKTFGLAAPLGKFLRERTAGAEVHVTSFLHQEIVEISRQCPAVERSIVLAAVPITFAALFADTQTQQVSLFRGYITETVVRTLHEQGIRVWAYPVDLPREAAQFASWGIEAIFTDDPAAMQAVRDRL
jgi:glycerophosphoryl diester phosphodiesterase